MNKVFELGRWTKDTELKTSGESSYARNTLAVDRGKDKNGEDKGTDFISCVAFGKTAEGLARFGTKGAKMLIEGRIQTGSYEGQDGKRVYTTDVIVERWEFAESKAVSQQSGNGFGDINANIEDDDLPFA